jgi:hypothetical protein
MLKFGGWSCRTQVCETKIMSFCFHCFDFVSRCATKKGAATTHESRQHTRWLPRLRENVLYLLLFLIDTESGMHGVDPQGTSPGRLLRSKIQ